MHPATSRTFSNPGVDAENHIHHGDANGYRSSGDMCVPAPLITNSAIGVTTIRNSAGSNTALRTIFLNDLL